MGKIFSSSTWRSPLQLIDCWLPLPSERRARPAMTGAAGNAVQRFARAGWLQREAANGPSVLSGQKVVMPSGSSAGCQARGLRQTESLRAPSRDTRLVISGTMGEVCAELDRLAALEQESAVRAA